MLGRAKKTTNPSESRITYVLLLTLRTTWEEGSLRRQGALCRGCPGQESLHPFPMGPAARTPCLHHMHEHQGCFDTLMLTPVL